MKGIEKGVVQQNCRYRSQLDETIQGSRGVDVVMMPQNLQECKGFSELVNGQLLPFASAHSSKHAERI